MAGFNIGIGVGVKYASASQVQKTSEGLVDIDDALLMENGELLLMESGDYIQLEESPVQLNSVDNFFIL